MGQKKFNKPCAIFALPILMSGLTFSILASAQEGPRSEREAEDSARSETRTETRVDTRTDTRAESRSSGVPNYPPSYHNASVQRPSIGRQTQSLPRGSQSIRVGRDNYNYHNGSYYRARTGGGYQVVRAPYGARISSLPLGYLSFLIGPSRYYYSNHTYYRHDRDSNTYIVIEEPPGAEQAVVSASQSGSGELFVYPNNEQTEEQRARDRYDCYLWAVEQTGFDPSSVVASEDSGDDYRRAISACLEGRGYTVK